MSDNIGKCARIINDLKDELGVEDLSIRVGQRQVVITLSKGSLLLHQGFSHEFFDRSVNPDQMVKTAFDLKMDEHASGGSPAGGKDTQ